MSVRPITAAHGTQPTNDKCTQTRTGEHKVDKREFRPQGKYGLEVRVFVDSDWAGDRVGARSTSGGCCEIGSCPLASWSRTQSVVAQSSGEAELMALTTGLSEGLGLVGLCSDALLPASLVLLTDSNAGRQICNRTGTGRVKHLDARCLLIQLLLRQRQVEIRRVPGIENPADILTKNVSSAVIDRLRSKLHLAAIGTVVAMLCTKKLKKEAGKEQSILAATMAWHSGKHAA